MTILGAPPADLVVRERSSRTRRAVAVPLVHAVAVVTAASVCGILLWSSRRIDPSDAFALLVWVDALSAVLAVWVWVRFASVVRPVPAVAVWAARSASVRAARALARLGVAASDDEWSAWRRGHELAVRRATQQLAGSGLATFLMVLALSPLLLVLADSAAGRYDARTGAGSLAVSLALTVLGAVVGARGGETTATRAWAAVETVALHHEDPFLDAGLVARRRRLHLTRLADAVAADLTAHRSADSRFARGRAAGVRSDAERRLDGPLADPATAWCSRDIAPLVEAWVTGRWSDLPEGDPAQGFRPRTSRGQAVAVFAGILLVLGLAFWVAQSIFDDLAAFLPLPLVALALTNIVRNRGSASSAEQTAVIERLMTR